MWHFLQKFVHDIYASGIFGSLYYDNSCSVSGSLGPAQAVIIIVTSQVAIYI